MKVPLHSPVHLGMSAFNKASRKIKRTRKAIGPDGTNPKAFFKKENWDLVERTNLQSRYLLSRGIYPFDLADEGKTYRPDKPPRSHAVLSLQDSTVLGTVTTALEPVWGRLPPSVIGGRPGSSAPDAAWEVFQHIRKGGLVTGADAVGAFPNTPWRVCLWHLNRISGRPDLCSVIEAFYLSQEAKFPGLIEGTQIAQLLMGIAMGTEVVPFVEPYLDCLYVWSDDFLLCGDEHQLEAALEALRDRLAALGLSLHEDGRKRVTTARDEIVFLGFWITPDEFSPSLDGCDTLIDNIEDALRKARSNGDDHQVQVRKCTTVIRGWVEYYADCNNSDPFEVLDLKVQSKIDIGRDLPRPSEVYEEARNSRDRRHKASKRWTVVKNKRKQENTGSRAKGDSPPPLWVTKSIKALTV